MVLQNFLQTKDMHSFLLFQQVGEFQMNFLGVSDEFISNLKTSGILWFIR